MATRLAAHEWSWRRRGDGYVRLSLELKWADCWIGAYWRITPGSLVLRGTLDVWVCLLPCLPLHLEWRL